VVLAVNPDRLLEKLPVVVPSVVLKLAIVGLVAVFQHIPLAVTEAPPLLVIFPPLVAVVVVMEVTAVVDRVGTTGETAFEVKLSSFPYAIPTLFVA
jgi:hypothetical protein